MARGLIANPAGNQLFGVFGDGFYTIAPTGERTRIGSLVTRRGHVGMKVGLNQVVVTDGGYGYVYDLTTKTWTRITHEGWLGSATVEYLAGYFTFIDPHSQTFYISANEDALEFDPTEFATAHDSPDKLVGQVVTARSLVLFGEVGAEVWHETGNVDFPLERNNGVAIDVGLMAPFTAKELDNSVYWLGRDERGAGMVYRLEGFRPVRVSTMAVEEVIQRAVRDGHPVHKSVAYAYQQDGHSFYCLQVPGLDTTWVYDAASGQWHERAELVDGDYAQHRGRYHAYAYNKHLIVGDDDVIYEYDPEVYTNAGDVLVRDRISPHNAVPTLERLNFRGVELDCEVGHGKAGQERAELLMRYSDDGGHSYGSWRTSTLGAVGERKARARFLRCGMARDRVWHFRVTDDTQFAIIGAAVDVTKATK